ncbi:hypothetical protein RJ641_023250 [Dillenia turbinata]|uniref:Uncharacterized protein n=1 Tax=Dillenia turbinata TaxID=194707 RepID=A0AAN8UID5_9MAGN
MEYGTAGPKLYDLKDLDLALLYDKPTIITDTNSTEYKIFNKAWERSNKLSLMFMRRTIAKNIKLMISKTDSAKKFIESV